MDRTNLGIRMKENYENRSKTYLIRRMPVIIRLDMKAGHSYTNNLKKPYDDLFIKAMQETTKYLCENIQCCKLGYTQSDEISLLLVDYDNLETQAWFNNQVQKICSVSASLATYKFNSFIEQFNKDINDTSVSRTMDVILKEWKLDKNNLPYNYSEAYQNKIAIFDSRAFNIPKEEVNNYFLWRQRDASKNSIQMLAQSLYSHKELLNLNGNQLQNKMLTEKDINWNNLDIDKKRGACIIKKETIEDDGDKVQNINEIWIIDKEIPLFNENKEYIESLI